MAQSNGKAKSEIRYKCHTFISRISETDWFNPLFKSTPINQIWCDESVVFIADFAIRNITYVQELSN